MPEIYLYMSKLLTEILTKRVDLSEEKKTILLYQIRVIIAEQTKLIIMLVTTIILGIADQFIIAYLVMRITRWSSVKI